MRSTWPDRLRRLMHLRMLLSAALLACALGFLAQASDAGGLMLWRRTAPKIFTLPLAVMGLLAGILLVVSYSRYSDRLLWVAERLFGGFAALRGLNYALFILTGILFPWLYLTEAGSAVWPYAPRIWVFGVFALTGSVFWMAARRGRSWAFSFATAMLAYGIFHRVALYIPQVSDYLFSLGWSEASRYYNASLFFARKIYGEALPLPTLHPTRYLLQSIPFLVEGLPLWFHRLWQVLLWVILNGAAAWALARRFVPQDSRIRWAVAAWAFLFFFQGPVYYHLIVCVLVVLWMFDARRFWRSMLVVAAASIWAGISRINWFPVPGLLAVILYLIEMPRENRPLLRYLTPPALWTMAGTALAFASQQVYILLSGNPAEQFSSSFTSDLLWYRLWPNATYAPGILRAVLYVSLPLALLFVAYLLRNHRALHPIRWLGIAAVLGVFLAGGVVVSVKIGGGSNLHNLDAYLALLAVVGAAVGLNKTVPDRPEKFVALQLNPLLVGIILLVPAWMTILEGSPTAPLPSRAAQEQALGQIQQIVQQMKDSGRPVLFINQRHLQTFDMVPEVEMIPDYEKVFLMEMVMGNNRPYLETFYRQLEDHEFGLIVTEPLYINYQDRTHGFSEENNVWMERVVAPIMQSYRPLVTFPDLGIQLRVPQE